MAKLQQFPLFPYAAQLVLQLQDLGFNGVVVAERPGVQGERHLGGGCEMRLRVRDAGLWAKEIFSDRGIEAPPPPVLGGIDRN